MLVGIFFSQVIVGTFFRFRNSRRKVCLSCVAFADKRAKVSICKTFLRNYGKQKNTNEHFPQTVSIPTLTFDTIPIKIVLMKIATEI